MHTSASNPQPAQGSGNNPGPSLQSPKVAPASVKGTRPIWICERCGPC